ncbi:FAD-dependent oxidoreductase [Solirubrobacter sp. CPCC 204708]|uniref:FAD-dependent oxidoreductase n=1 Tax=Solirubrobacter deserti TaxID=2282478 RepID=A0ABT4RL29_9ACTN|nr:FAD-dependent oxidoreductase [Solirubrobacter deserti]MBE2319012.1 FAD-dependent oxidoreductase [Solirubrobacter deserti]MDA0139263.1 FAD-dependent oxidoreductase [Solirubrobacter deserti]
MARVVIVGAGTFGASLAWHLAGGGDDVVLIDQFEPGDPRATSGGETRLIRCAHGPDADYAAMARRARTLWRELEAETGTDLLTECGVSWFAHRDDGWEAASAQTLHALDIPAERQDVADAARRFPSLNGADLTWVLHEPEAGVLRAAHAVRALAQAATERGARIVHGRAAPDGDRVVLEGDVYEADRVVWSCGGWLATLFPAVVQLRVTLQQLFFYDGGPGWERAPAWIDYDRAVYGTGDLHDLGVKCAWDEEGPPLDPDAPLPDATPQTEALMRGYVAERFPALAAAPLKGTRTCRYELTADSEFLAAEHDGVWLVGGGSGHGFKHGPALAERVIAAWDGGEPLPARFGLHRRERGTSLRTAGSNL